MKHQGRSGRHRAVQGPVSQVGCGGHCPACCCCATHLVQGGRERELLVQAHHRSKLILAWQWQNAAGGPTPPLASLPADGHCLGASRPWLQRVHMDCKLKARRIYPVSEFLQHVCLSVHKCVCSMSSLMRRGSARVPLAVSIYLDSD
jgi:hypothetical protein